MDFLFFYENVNREYESLSLLKCELERRGYSVAISHFNFTDWGWHALFSTPKVVCCPWLRYDSCVSRYYMFRKVQPKLVNLQWEQVYSMKGIESGLTTINGEARKAFHLCWGEKSKKRLIKEGVPEENIFINGPLQFDFCRPEFQEYYFSKKELAAEFNLPENSPWNIYISSFSFATLSEERLADIEKQIGGDYHDFVKISRDSQKKTLDWIENFLQKNKDVIFIYRPHPAETTCERLVEMQKKYPNLKVITKYSVRQWGLVVDRIGVWVSTSCGEIYAMGKKCAIIRPLDFSAYYDLEYMLEADVIKQESDFDKFFAGELKQEKFPVSESLLKQYYNHLPEKFSYMRTADILEKILSQSGDKAEYSLNSEVACNFLKARRKNLLISLLTTFYDKLGLRLGKLLPFKIVKDCDRFLDRETLKYTYAENVKAFFHKKLLPSMKKSL